ncbi:MAG: molybdopterin-synthase adenylyltransferase MoeB [Gammaproteobacteria bacterium]|nr:molybdopterin-synthase adenylyltransferase MoeB [Gammaproteobacteria bacterium]
MNSNSLNSSSLNSSSLTDDELIQFARQIILPELDETGQLALKNAQVAIFGLGGLGSPVSLYLAAAGIGTLYLIDHDRVEQSNLQRQIAHSTDTVEKTKVESAAARCLSLNPFINVHPIERKITNQESFAELGSCSVLVDCLDTQTSRRWLNQLSLKLQLPLVSASAIRFEGQLSVFNFDSNTPCYECLYPTQPNEESCFEKGVMGPVVGAIGSLQAMEVIKLITGIGKSLIGQLLMYDAKLTHFEKLKIKKNKLCSSCRTLK